MHVSKVYIIILNYNNPKDTRACLSSIAKLCYGNFKVIVIDNNSTDNSELQIKKHISELRDNRFFFIQTGENRGYAGGNNVGIQLALKDPNMEYVWILNNDTIVDKNALFELVKKIKDDEHMGICGSKLIYEWDRTQLQGYGGRYNYIISKSTMEKNIANIDNMDFVSGASMLISRVFLEKIGMFCEDYFLYFEELDLRERSKHQFSIGCAVNSIVYHKEGGSMGSCSNGKQRSELSDYFFIRNRILFTKKYYPFCLPIVYLGLLIAIFNRVKRDQTNRAWWIIKLMCGIKNSKFEPKYRQTFDRGLQ